MSRYEKNLEGAMADDIKLAGLEALVPEELEKHLMLYFDRWRTIEDARLGNRDVRGGEVWLDNS